MANHIFSGRQKDIIVAQFLRGDCALNLNGLYSFTESPDEMRITEAIEVVSEHFLSLRTKAAVVNGELVPKVVEGVVQVEKIERATAREQFDEIYHQCRKPFDLFSERPMRAFLLGDGNRVQHMLLQFHHVATDWWSFRIIHKSLLAVYEGGDNVSLPIDNVLANNGKSLFLENSTESIDFWNRILQPPVFNFDTERCGSSTHHQWKLNIDAEKIESVARKSNLTLFEWLFIQFGKAVTSITCMDTLINIPVGNRSEVSDIQTVGYLMNVVPIRCCVFNGQFDKHETLKILRDGISHGCVPRSYFARMLDNSTGHHGPLFDIVFMFLRDGIGGVNMPGDAEFTRIYPGEDEDRFVVTVRELDGKFAIVTEGSIQDEFGTAVIEQFLDILEDIQ
ncbi:Tyrocidine synthase 3 [Corynebacterium diphtheriae subsp. lausannense]|uniref:condensation domain-containing protein n=1 Tax=Corynebacterium belfantii TaxID=2014537 RepID=UPI00095AF962|nr:condensation domain-containing protein [Corynebacterium belfantii]OLN14548.1 hypothetical protein BUE64_12465 [Corynebacterium diphtheriae subsp. lausannense]MBG9244922.1 hypothetical protein [Corynebacterium belfantii]MBG9311405.1 hypothetical protein [Corynebacterium belfantii]MBG9320459.1 hypothetical protein [Corynebacterium belfantii]MBG9325506.1 hypothetical protein [Corynebacterium belfantii]